MAYSLGEISALVTLDKQEFDRGLDSLPGKAENTFKKIAGLAASYLSYRSLMGSVNAYFVQQDAVEGLRSSLRNLGHQTRQTMEEYQKFASMMQSRTRYGDEGTLQAMAQGVRLGIDPSRLQEVTEAAIGLSTRVGIDLPNAMQLLARASHGHTEMLARYGVAIDGTKDKMEQFNDVLEWSKVGVAMAEDAAKTAQGQFEQMANAMGDASEKLGEGVAEGLRPVWTGVKSMSEAFSDAAPIVKRLTGELSLLGAGMAALATLGVSVTGPVGLAVAGASLLAVGLNELGAEERRLHSERQRRFAEEHADAVSAENASRLQAASDRERMARLQQLGTFLDLTNDEQKEAAEIVEELTKRYGELGVSFDGVNKSLSVQSSAMGMIGRLRELSERQEATAEEQREAERIAESLNRMYQGLGMTVENVSGRLQVQADSWDELTRLHRLARETTEMSNAEQTEARRLIEELTKRYGDFGVTFDAATGKIIAQKDAWEKLNEAQRQNAINEARKVSQASKREFNTSLMGLPENVSWLLSPFDRNMLKDDVDRIRDAYLKSPEEGLRVARGIRDVYTDEKGVLKFDNLAPYIEDVIKKLEQSIEDDKRLKEMERDTSAVPKLPSGAGATAGGEGAGSSGVDRRKDMLEAIQEMRWQNDFDASDKDRQLQMLEDRITGMREQLWETARNKSEDEYNEEELKLLQEILRTEGQADALRRGMENDETGQEQTRKYSDNYGSFYAAALAYGHANNNEQKIVEYTKKTAQNTKDTKDAIDTINSNLTWG